MLEFCRHSSHQSTLVRASWGSDSLMLGSTGKGQSGTIPRAAHSNTASAMLSFHLENFIYSSQLVVLGPNGTIGVKCNFSNDQLSFTHNVFFGFRTFLTVQSFPDLLRWKKKIYILNVWRDKTKGHPPSADLRYERKYSISPSTLIFAATKS